MGRRAAGGAETVGRSDDRDGRWTSSKVPDDSGAGGGEEGDAGHWSVTDTESGSGM
jgi:hypothetical protein